MTEWIIATLAAIGLVTLVAGGIWLAVSVWEWVGAVDSLLKPPSANEEFKRELCERVYARLAAVEAEVRAQRRRK